MKAFKSNTLLKGKKIVNLTPAKLEILKIFQNYQSSKPFAPTIQELAQLLRKSRATVFEHCVGLQESGFLCASRGRARSLRLTDKAIGLLKSLCLPQEQAEDGDNLANSLPLVGMINAGLPAEAIENSERITLDTEFATGKGNTFALEVSGDSMINDNICPGDYVVCKQNAQPKNGDIVVAIVDDTEATLKRFYKEKKHIKLQPSNDKYQPIITKNCQVRGVVVGLIRKIKA